MIAAIAAISGWIPVIGPFLKAAFASFDHYQDTKVQQADIAAKKEVALDTNSVEVIKARAAVPLDIGAVFARDVILNWYAVYVSLIFYDSCFRNLLPAGWTWRVLALPTSLNILCAAIVAFLFYTAWRGEKG